MSNIPDTMQAFVLTGHGDLDMLVHHTDWPVPVPGKTDVLIKVGACGLNNTDINTRTGWYSKAVSEATDGAGYNTVGEDDPAWGGSPVTFPRIQGADAAGTIVAAGAGVDSSFVGKRVITDNWMRDWSDPLNLDKTGYFGSERDGGYAEYCCIDYRNVGVIESTLSDAELATFSCSYTLPLKACSAEQPLLKLIRYWLPVPPEALARHWCSWLNAAARGLWVWRHLKNINRYWHWVLMPYCHARLKTSVLS